MNWVASQPGITSPIIGATSVNQIDDNLRAVEFDIPEELGKRLDEASALAPAHPYLFFSPAMQAMINGGVLTQAWAPARATGAPTLPGGH